MTRAIRTPDGRALDLDYFVEWRPYLWSAPVAHALKSLGNLEGKRLLEIGGRSGRMVSLYAMFGADVTMLEKGDCDAAAAEAEKWGVADRVRLLSTQGGFEAVRGERFDRIVTKSVLWSIEHLGSFLDELEPLLAPGGKVAFVENVRGGGLMRWLRANVIHHGKFNYGHYYWGITRRQIHLFDQRFGDLQVRRHRWFVYSILGNKKT